MRLVPIYNLRGGCAKTTTACLLAEALAEKKGARVLLLDADPQNNLSLKLMRQEEVNAALDANSLRNMEQFLRLAMTGKTVMKPSQYISQSAGTIQGRGCVDLVIGHPFVSESNRQMAVHLSTLGDILWRRLKDAYSEIGQEYDYVIADCPPTWNIVVESLCRSADAIVVPTLASQDASFTFKGLKYNLENVNIDLDICMLVVSKLAYGETATARANEKGFFGSKILPRIRKSSAIEKQSIFLQSAGQTLAKKYDTKVSKTVGELVNDFISKTISLRGF